MYYDVSDPSKQLRAKLVELGLHVRRGSKTGKTLLVYCANDFQRGQLDAAIRLSRGASL